MAPREHGERGKDREERDSEFLDKLVHINRVAKVVKGGKRFGFAALVVVGDQKGRVGFGHGKAREVPEAVRKATESAKRGLVRVPLREGRTLHHDFVVRHWLGPVPLDGQGNVTHTGRLSIAPDWKPADLGLVVFIQQQHTGDVLQALALPLGK